MSGRRGNRDIERPENAPVERMDASLDTLRVLQRDGAGRPEEQGTGMAADAIVKAFPSDRRERFRGIERPEKCPVDIFQQDGAGRPAVGGFPGKCLHCSGKDGRGRSRGRKYINQRYRRGTDLFRPGLAAGPPSPEGEGFWMCQQLFLIPNPYSLIPAPHPHKSKLLCA